MRVERLGAVSVVRLEGGKANAMTGELLSGLVRLMDEAEASGAGALVLTGQGRHFSAGLPVPDIIGLERDAMRAFIEAFADAMLRVYRCPLPVVAALNGHAIAGGCVLAMMADYRMGAEGGAKIGLNEVQLGIGLPSIVIEPLRLIVPGSAMLPIAMEGRLLSPHEALELSLIDEVVPQAELETRALTRAEKLAASPGPAFAQVKNALRRPALEAIEQHRAAETERWLETWFSPPARARLEALVGSLKS